MEHTRQRCRRFGCCLAGPPAAAPAPEGRCTAAPPPRAARPWYAVAAWAAGTALRRGWWYPGTKLATVGALSTLMPGVVATAPSGCGLGVGGNAKVNWVANVGLAVGLKQAVGLGCSSVAPDAAASNAGTGAGSRSVAVSRAAGPAAPLVRAGEGLESGAYKVINFRLSPVASASGLAGWRVDVGRLCGPSAATGPSR